ncbi:hypothetical protein K503DRAFT_858939 [Rhizopogon vinicolor AM-OR11-026]|uniref:Uncharacterized protein n=1 Tax=Rhizopogon vinicolor AM-OR11-026 TaxID=1314800 RepID=A0A1B7MQJ8_9AGAM|nr:hypothetical protein K503DRAFT_858939 [Rhizopogon vinicolor AM-OR11-026]
MYDALPLTPLELSILLTIRNAPHAPVSRPPRTTATIHSSSGIPFPSSAPATGASVPDSERNIDTKSGGEAGMAGVGWRGFAAAAAAMFAASLPHHDPSQKDTSLAIDGRRANAPQYLDIKCYYEPCHASLSIEKQAVLSSGGTALIATFVSERLAVRRRQPIEGPCAVTHAGKRYHPEHLLCEFENECGERLAEYWEVDGQMFCKKHAALPWEEQLPDGRRVKDEGRARKCMMRFIDLRAGEDDAGKAQDVDIRYIPLSYIPSHLDGLYHIPISSFSFVADFAYTNGSTCLVGRYIHTSLMLSAAYFDRQRSISLNAAQCETASLVRMLAFGTMISEDRRVVLWEQHSTQGRMYSTFLPIFLQARMGGRDHTIYLTTRYEAFVGVVLHRDEKLKQRAIMILLNIDLILRRPFTFLPPSRINSLLNSFSLQKYLLKKPSSHSVVGCWSPQNLGRSRTYRISMVLHPQHKLSYFNKAAQWEDDWIKTAEQLVREEFERLYLSVDVNSDLGCGEDVLESNGWYFSI